MFSIIVTLYNKEKSIINTLNSVLVQIFDQFELIVINDGSTDNGLQLVESIKDPRIKVYTVPNSGVSAARNYGVFKSKYDYITFIDADDLWHPEFLSEVKQLIAEFSNAALWSAYHHLEVKGEYFSYPTGKREGYRGYFTDYFTCLNKYYNTIIWTGTVVIRKEVFHTLGGFNSQLSLGEDIDLWFRIALKHPLVFYNKILATYRIDAENRSIDKSHPFEKSFLSKVENYLKDKESPKPFKSYLRNYIAHNLAGYYFSADYNKVKNLKTYLSKKGLPLKWQVLYFGPYGIMKWLFHRNKK